MTIEETKEAMYGILKEYQGKKKFKPQELSKEIESLYGVSREDCKEAIKGLIDSERCVYSYFGGTFIEVKE
ncbi:MAG: hypothetical protein AB1595_02675 [bacterium]